MTTDTTIKLKACPFCGSKDVYFLGKSLTLYCGGCEIVLSDLEAGNNGATQESIAEMWNRRTDTWVSVESDLPEPYEVVLLSILGKNGFGEPDSYSTLGSYNRNTKAWDLIVGSLCEGEKVTYWQRLPDSPKEGE